MAWGKLESLYTDKLDIKALEPTLEYSDKYHITKGDWIRVHDRFYGYNRPRVYLDYNIDANDDCQREERSRNVWLRTVDGQGIQSVSYCSKLL